MSNRWLTLAFLRTIISKVFIYIKKSNVERRRSDRSSNYLFFPISRYGTTKYDYAIILTRQRGISAHIHSRVRHMRATTSPAGRLTDAENCRADGINVGRPSSDTRLSSSSHRNNNNDNNDNNADPFRRRRRRRAQPPPHRVKSRIGLRHQFRKHNQSTVWFYVFVVNIDWLDQSWAKKQIEITNKK